MGNSGMIDMSSINAGMEDLKAIAHRKNNPASFMQKRMMKLILEHQSFLSEDEELGICVIGGNAPSFHLRSISYSDPDILRFIGKDAEGRMIQLIQHHSQMGVMIVSVPKLDEKAYRVGFVPATVDER